MITRAMRADLMVISDTQPAIQAEIDTQRRLREASLRRVGDEQTENSDHWHGIAPAGVLNKGNGAEA